MRAKTKITYNRDGSVKKIVSNVGQTHHNRAAYELHCNSTRPTFGLKLRRFLKRLRLTAVHYADKARYNKHHPAALMPFIGVEDSYCD